jgi:hypothetical protein
VSYEEYNALKRGIETVLDEILANLKERFNGSPVVQKQNEPLKRKKSSKLAE